MLALPAATSSSERSPGRTWRFALGFLDNDCGFCLTQKNSITGK